MLLRHDRAWASLFSADTASVLECTVWSSLTGWWWYKGGCGADGGRRKRWRWDVWGKEGQQLWGGYLCVRGLLWNDLKYINITQICIWDQDSMSIKHPKTHLDVIFINAVTSSAFHSTDGPCLSSDNIDWTARLPVHTHTHKSKSDHYVESICVSEEDEMCAAHCKPLNQHKNSQALIFAIEHIETHATSVNAIFLLIWEISSHVDNNIFSSRTQSSYTLAWMCAMVVIAIHKSLSPLKRGYKYFQWCTNEQGNNLFQSLKINQIK